MRRHSKASPAATIDGNGIGRGRLGLCVAMLALAILAFGASVARADTRYVQTGEFGTADLGNVPTGIATEDATGRVFVVDRPNNRVVVFESGNPGAAVLTTFGTGELSAPFGIAIDQSSGDVYVSDAGNDRIVRYESDGATPPVYTLDATYTSPAKGTGAEEVGSFASQLAIDPVSGDLLVADAGNKRVERFDDTGAFVSSFDGSDAGAAFTSLIDVTADDDGNVYVVANGTVEPEFEGMSGAVVQSFEADGTFGQEIGAGELGDARAVAFDAVGGRLFVVSGGGVFNPGQTLRAYEGATAVEAIGISPSGNPSVPADVSTRSNGKGPISVLEAKTFFGSEGISGVEAFRLVTSPEVAIAAPQVLSPTSAMLNGTVDSNGEADTVFHFEYRVPPQFVTEIPPWQSTPDQTAGSGPSPEAVEAEATGLLPNQTYEVRLAASTAGLSATSGTITFKTTAAAPVVKTEGATAINATGATLNGSVNPEGTQTTFYFEYGTTTAYGSRTPVFPASAGASRVFQQFNRAVGGLLTGIPYHFRIVAENAGGRSVGNDQTFVPLPALVENRAYEQVTPVDKEGGIPEALVSMKALGDGDSVVVTLRSAPRGIADGNSFQNRFVSTRSAAGWERWVDADAVTGSAQAILAQHTNQATADDGEHAFVASNLALAPGADPRPFVLNLYIKNLRTKTYQFVGSSNAPFAYVNFTSGGSADKFKAGAPDFSWVVFVSDAPMLPGVTEPAMYRWTRTNGLELVSKLPDGSIPSAVVPNFGSEQYASRRVSRDGSRMFFELLGVGVFLWENGQVRAISKSELDGTVKDGNFDDASADGRYAFLSSKEALTADADPNPSGENLYRVDVVSGDVEFIGPIRSGPTLGSRNSVVASTADGSIVYFLSTLPLSTGLETKALEVWEGGGAPRVVTEEIQGLGSQLPASLSPSGRYLGYEWGGDLHVYDNATGQISCASCRAGETTGVAFLAGQRGEFDNRHSQTMLNDGRLFFTTSAALVPQDVNGVLDVYSYQAGQQALISPGTQANRAILGDVSPSGRDVFFTTAQRLVAQDIDDQLDVYDARVGGGIASQNQAPPVPCRGEGCQPAVTPPPSGASIGSEGGGNQTAARKAKHKKKNQCAKKKGKKKCHKGKKKHQKGKKNAQKGKRGAGR